MCPSNYTATTNNKKPKQKQTQKQLKDRAGEPHMSTSSNKQQKKGKDGMGNAGKIKETVKDRRVQQMYVEGRCVKGVYAIVRKSIVYVCVW